MTAAIGLLAWCALGAILGLAYMALLRRTVAAIAEEAGWVTALYPLALRAGLAVAVFGTAARIGAAEPVAALCGFLLVRTFIVGRMERA